jgi:hypothetical protein
MAERLKFARELGDIRENAEYDAAKNEQGLMEARIRTLEHMLRDPEIIEAPVNADAVRAGMVVTVMAEGDDEEENYLLAESRRSAPPARGPSPPPRRSGERSSARRSTTRSCTRRRAGASATRSSRSSPATDPAPLFSERWVASPHRWAEGIDPRGWRTLRGSETYRPRGRTRAASARSCSASSPGRIAPLSRGSTGPACVRGSSPCSRS